MKDFVIMLEIQQDFRDINLSGTIFAAHLAAVGPQKQYEADRFGVKSKPVYHWAYRICDH